MKVTQVEKMYRNNLQGNHWLPVTLEDCINQTEGLGFYDKGTVTQMLTSGERIRTGYADFRMVKPLKQQKNQAVS